MYKLSANVVSRYSHPELVTSTKRVSGNPLPYLSSCIVWIFCPTLRSLLTACSAALSDYIDSGIKTTGSPVLDQMAY